MRVCPECDTQTEAEHCPKDGRQTVEEARLKVQTRDPNIGLVIEGKYELVVRLGRGGMGSVYQATHKETGGSVAIKVMRADMVEDEDAIRRFYIEAQNTHKLHHPNTVRISDFGQTDDGILFLVMEYVKGRSLLKVLKDEGRLAPSRAVRVLSQVLKSLGEAHQHGVIHRDIKPDNVMLIDQFGEPDFVKVLDFGISRTLEGTGASTKGAIGTPKYMAPEQWRGKKVDARADLYACGGLLYRMLCGHLPFHVEGKGSAQVVGYMTAHLNDEPRPMNVDIPAELSQLVASLLAKDLTGRPADAEAALLMIRHIEKHCDLSDEGAKTVAGAESAVGKPVHDAHTHAPGNATATAVVDPENGKHGAISNASATGFPGVNRVPQHSTSPQGLALAIAVAATLIVGTITWLGGSGDDTAEEPMKPQVSVPITTQQPVATEPSAEARTPPPTRTEAQVTKRLLTLTSTPSGSLVKTSDGRVVGTTPLTLSRRDSGEPSLTILPDASERSITRVVISHAGHLDKTVDLSFPAQPGAEGTMAIVLFSLPTLTIDANKKATKVRLQGTTEVLGHTPFQWTVPADVVARIRAGETVNLEFLSRAGVSRTAVTEGHLAGTTALNGVVRSKARQRNGRKKSGSGTFTW